MNEKEKIIKDSGDEYGQKFKDTKNSDEDVRKTSTKEFHQDNSDKVDVKNPEEENLEGDEAFVQKEKNNEENLLEEIERLRDEKLRLLADMENLRKRFDRDKMDSIRYGGMNLARDILSPDDNLTRALDAIPREEKNSEGIKNLIDGLKMVQKEFSTILQKYGIKKIESLNIKFDHNYHQAMVEIENDEVESGTVIQEMQSGYMMHERLLRPAMVGVSKKSLKIEKNDESK